MRGADFEPRMRAFEYYHGLRVIPNVWTVLRVDGRGFTRFTEGRFEKPFDLRFHGLMTQVATTLVDDLRGVLAYTESDEISVLFRPEWDLFDREVEKLVSVSAGLASATFTKAVGDAAHFDSRIWIGVDEVSVIDYFRWRQTDAARCALHGHCYWALRKEGKSVAEATRELEGKSVEFKNELLFERGINFNDLPLWQRRGSAVYWETYTKGGFNPKTGQAVQATRRRLKVDDELPMKEEYAALLARILAESRSAAA